MGVPIPTDVVSTHGDTVQEVVEHLKKSGYVPNDHVVTELKLTIVVDEVVEVEDIESMPFEPM